VLILLLLHCDVASSYDLAIELYLHFDVTNIANIGILRCLYFIDAVIYYRSVIVTFRTALFYTINRFQKGRIVQY
jgi:hypothetical protein